MELIEFLKQKTLWTRQEMLKIHKIAPETRLASSLSDVEIFVCLYYGKILNFNPKDLHWEDRDRFIISKGHGAISLYPILADLGFFDKEELKRVCKEDSFLGSIPDDIPGFETINGSLGHGLGVASGVALALKRKSLNAKVFVLLGDGEINEGSVWEAVMFASFHKLSNLVAIVDNNKMSMLGYQKEILGLDPLDEKFKAFGWKTKVVDGHDIEKLYFTLDYLKNDEDKRPKVLIAETKKGKSIPQLEDNPLCHVRSLTEDEVDEILRDLEVSAIR